MPITPIQQLLSAQRIADVQIQSNQIFKNLSIVSRLAGSLSNGNSIDIIDALKSNNLLIGDMDDHLVVAGYLLSKYSDNKTKIHLTCLQIKLAIVEVEKEIELIKFQKDPKLIPQLKWTKHLLHKLEHKYKKQCKSCKK